MKSISSVHIRHLCSVIVGLMFAAYGVAEVDLDGAVALWLFEEGSGDIAVDGTGNGNDGVLTDGPLWVDGKFGTALELDGKGSYVFVEEPQGLPTGADPRTICLSFKWTEVKWPCPAMQLLGYGKNAPGQRFGLSIECNPHGMGIETCMYARTFEWEGDTDWHDVAVVVPEGATSTGEVDIYLDGVLQDAVDRATNQDLKTTGAPLAIGCIPSPQVYHFNGTIDEVAIFGEELSPGDLVSIGANGLLGATAVSSSGKLAVAWGRLKVK